MQDDANPYRWNLVEPALFYGRREVAESLVERVLAGDRFAVAAGRRMGKTTLLRRVEADLGALGPFGGLIVLPVFVDVTELASLSAEDVYRLLGRRIGQAARAAALETDDLEAASGPELAEQLRGLLQVWRRLGRLQLVFLFDEIERALGTDWGPGFLAYWRMLLNNMGELSRCVSAIFCGARGIYRIAQDAGSPLGNILAWQELELFDHDETARLVREPTGQPWPASLVEKIFDLSGGHPCLIQYLMQRVYDGDPDGWSDSLDGAADRFLREQSTIFASWWQSFEEAGQAIYERLARGGPVAEGELIAQQPDHGKRALDVLAHTGVVRWDRAGRTVEMAGSLFQSWAESSVLKTRVLSRQSGPPASGQADQAGGDAWGLGVGRRIATVLFTDIVSSTRMTAELGDRRWLQLLDAHNARVREALAAFRGREVKTMGDSFLALFETPAAAIRCACTIASSVRPLGLEVRAGLHAGEYEAVGDDVIGIAISYAAWVMSRARGGEVIVSETVRGLVAGSGIQFVDRGAHRVKGTRERHKLFAVDHVAHPRNLALP